MNRTSLFIFALLLASAPFDGLYAARLVAASMAKEVSAETLPMGITDSFRADAPALHMVAVLADVAAGTKVKGVWVAVAAGEVKNYEIDSTTSTLQAGEARAHFELTRPTKGWPSGNYKLDLYVDGVFVTSVPFKVGLDEVRTPKAAAAAQASSGGGRVVGSWQCLASHSGATGAASTVTFGPSGEAMVNGRQFGYKLLPGKVLRLMDQSGASDYSYQLGGNQLVMHHTDGSSFNCVRAASANPMMGGPRGTAGPPGQAGGYAQGGYGMGGAPQGSGNEWQLQGTFCHYGSSSSYTTYSSYSHTKRISFDGRGRWTLGSESAYSGNAGIAYGGQGNQDSGSYRVAGNQIQYQTAAGEQGVASVNMRQNDGRITEITVDGQLYAPQLCQ